MDHSQKQDDSCDDNDDLPHIFSINHDINDWNSQLPQQKQIIMKSNFSIHSSRLLYVKPQKISIHVMEQTHQMLWALTQPLICQYAKGQTFLP